MTKLSPIIYINVNAFKKMFEAESTRSKKYPKIFPTTNWDTKDMHLFVLLKNSVFINLIKLMSGFI
jgi:hypothetical protein